MKEHRKAIINQYIKSYNNFDIAGMTQDLNKEIVFENHSDGETNLSLQGINEFINQARKAKLLFERREIKAKDWSFDEDRTTINVAYTAILANDLFGQKKGAEIKMEGSSTFYFRGEQIIKIVDKS